MPARQRKREKDKNGRGGKNKGKKKIKKGSKPFNTDNSLDSSQLESDSGLSEDDQSFGRNVDGDTKLHKKIVAPKGRSTVSPTLFALLLVLLVGIAGGIYVYNFVDVSDVIENVKARYASIQDTKSPPTSSHSTVTPPPPPKSQSNPEEPPVQEQNSKTSTNPSKETQKEQPPKETAGSTTSQESSKETRKEQPPKETASSKTSQESSKETRKEQPPKETASSKTSQESSKETQNEQPPKETESSKTSQESSKEQSSKETQNAKTSHETSQDLPAKEPQNSKPMKKEPQDTTEKAYPKAAITNAADYAIRSDLDEADSLLDKKLFQKALSEFKMILEANPSSPRAQYGKAMALDRISEHEKSNQQLEHSIAEYMKMLTIPDVPEDLLYTAIRRCSDRQSFRGWGHKAAKSLEQLSMRYPDDIKLYNDVGVKYLMIGKNEEGRKLFKEAIKHDPNDGFAKVHLGFILKTVDNNMEEGIKYLQEGIDSNEPGTQDGRFFFHLGDAYYRIKQPDQAYKVYEKGAEQGLFLSPEQRSLYNVDRLTGRPWWTKEQTKNEKQLKVLQDNWKTIKDEGLAQLDPKTGGFVPEEENLRESGDWKQLTLFQQGRKNEKNCRRAPKTCALVAKFTEASGCKRGQVKYSVMHPGVHVWPHCGPTNCRIRAHLGLVVPEGPRIRVGRTNETRGWTEGEFIIFDDSFEHEVWHDGDSLRLVLIIDMWHPELTANEKQTLAPI